MDVPICGHCFKVEYNGVWISFKKFNKENVIANLKPTICQKCMKGISNEAKKV